MALSTTVKVNLALLLAITAWSMSFVAIRMGLEGYSPGSLSLFRYAIASICLGLFVPFVKQSLRVTMKQVLWLLATGAIGIAGYSLLLNSGEISVSSGIASFIVAQTPVVTAALAIGFLKEKPALLTIVGIAISCLGVTIIVTGQPVQLDVNMGFLLITLATFCGSLQAILQKHLLKTLQPFCVSAFTMWFAALTLAAFVPDLIADIKTAPMTSTYAVLFLGIVPSTLGQWLWNYGLSKTMVVRATAYLYAMPILSTLMGWVLLQEIPAQQALIGGLIALLGAILVKKDATEAKKTHQFQSHNASKSAE